MNLLLFDQSDVAMSDVLSVTGDRARHLTEVMRVKRGDTVRVGKVGGNIGNAVVVQAEQDRVLLEIVNLDRAPDMPLADLIVALPRPQILKRVLHIAACMGVRRLWLIRSQRVEKSYFSSPVLQPEEITRYLREGMEQGISTIVPQVSVHNRFRRFVEDELPLYIERGAHLLLPHPGAAESLASLGLQQRLQAEDSVCLAVGPEGGWREHEVDAFVAKGFTAFHCGPRIMRVDNAVCSLLGQIDLLRRISGGIK